jgi:hypothetical protein
MSDNDKIRFKPSYFHQQRFYEFSELKNSTEANNEGQERTPSGYHLVLKVKTVIKIQKRPSEDIPIIKQKMEKEKESTFFKDCREATIRRHLLANLPIFAILGGLTYITIISADALADNIKEYFALGALWIVTLTFFFVCSYCCLYSQEGTVSSVLAKFWNKRSHYLNMCSIAVMVNSLLFIGITENQFGISRKIYRWNYLLSLIGILSLVLIHVFTLPKSNIFFVLKDHGKFKKGQQTAGSPYKNQKATANTGFMRVFSGDEGLNQPLINNSSSSDVGDNPLPPNSDPNARGESKDSSVEENLQDCEPLDKLLSNITHKTPAIDQFEKVMHGILVVVGSILPALVICVLQIVFVPKRATEFSVYLGLTLLLAIIHDLIKKDKVQWLCWLTAPILFIENWVFNYAILVTISNEMSKKWNEAIEAIENLVKLFLRYVKEGKDLIVTTIVDGFVRMKHCICCQCNYFSSSHARMISPNSDNAVDGDGNQSSPRTSEETRNDLQKRQEELERKKLLACASMCTELLLLIVVMMIFISSNL